MSPVYTEGGLAPALSWANGFGYTELLLTPNGDFKTKSKVTLHSRTLSSFSLPAGVRLVPRLLDTNRRREANLFDRAQIFYHRSLAIFRTGRYQHNSNTRSFAGPGCGTAFLRSAFAGSALRLIKHSLVCEPLLFRVVLH